MPHKLLLDSFFNSLVQLAPQNTEIFNARNLVQILLRTTGEEKVTIIKKKRQFISSDLKTKVRFFFLCFFG